MIVHPPGSLLVTGLYRSGTTLLEKLLHAHPALCVASQPFPALYHHAKAAFLKSRMLDRRYPLDHLFLEDGYTPGDLCTFLDEWIIDPAGIDALFEALAADEKGLWTPEILKFHGQTLPGTFLNVSQQLLGFVAELFPKSALQRVGSKEILCEEFVPYLVGHGRCVVIVIRDPRSVIASTNYGRYREFTGDIRPTLYTVRNWRKSVAIALACQSLKGFTVVKYEDLASDPVGVVNRVCTMLGVSVVAHDAYASGVRTQRGEQWNGNSSFGALSGVEQTPRDQSLSRLPADAISYIEATCLPELLALGYELQGARAFDERAIFDFQEPFVVQHARFDSSYSTEPARVASEVERYNKLTGPRLSDECARRWFLHRTAYERLSESVRNA